MIAVVLLWGWLGIGAVLAVVAVVSEPDLLDDAERRSGLRRAVLLAGIVATWPRVLPQLPGIVRRALQQSRDER
jgi:hypothetical protein